MLRRMMLPTLVAAALVAAGGVAPAAELSSPRSLGFGTNPLGGSAQAPSLWYYGPSYSLHYDQLPPGRPSAGQPYRPSLRSDPYYGYDYLDRSERGHRFDR